MTVPVKGRKIKETGKNPYKVTESLFRGIFSGKKSSLIF